VQTVMEYQMEENARGGQQRDVGLFRTKEPCLPSRPVRAGYRALRERWLCCSALSLGSCLTGFNHGESHKLSLWQINAHWCSRRLATVPEPGNRRYDVFFKRVRSNCRKQTHKDDRGGWPRAPTAESTKVWTLPSSRSKFLTLFPQRGVQQFRLGGTEQAKAFSGQHR